jgi:recombination protein RecA
MLTSYGEGAAKRASKAYNLDVIPTGSLALDYALGTGGWPRGHLIGVYGPRDIGKSSIIGFNAIRSAQERGLNPVIIAVESNAYDDPSWFEKNGVDPEKVVILYPETGEDAFAMMHKASNTGYTDLIVFDSVGALLSASEIDEKGKMKAGGQAGLVTWGVKRCVHAIHKNRITCLMLNQVRDVMSARTPGLLQQPGGNALEHSETMICQLKRTANRFITKIDGEDVEYGAEIAVIIKRNKLAEGSGKKALFNFYNMALPGIDIGIDKIADALNTGKRLGVVKTRGAWVDLPDSSTHNGAGKAADHLRAHPEALTTIRNGVIEAMLNGGAELVLDNEETDE